MRLLRRNPALACLILATGLFAGSPAFSGCIQCGAAKPGKACGQLVTVKHPDLKGAARKKEWDKCMANPGGYNG